MQAKLALLDTLALFYVTPQGKLAGVDIKDRIKARRLKLKLSHEQLAAKVSQLEGLKKNLAWQTVQQWENGTTVPRPRRLEFVAEALGMTLEELMGPKPAARLQSGHVKEERGSYASSPWPFQVVSREQVASLSSQQLSGLEKIIVRYLLQPVAVEWRSVALDIAAEADQVNHDETFTNFVRSVDLKLREISSSKPSGIPAT